MNKKFSSSYFIKFSRKFSTTASPQLSLTKLALIKVRVLGEFTLRTLASPLHTSQLWGTKKLESSKTGKIAIVLGNGPSAANLDLNMVKSDQDSGMLEIFGVNTFPLSDLAKKISQRYYLVLSDPLHRPSIDTPHSRELWQKVKQSEQISIIAPTTWSKEIKRLKLKNSVNYFNDMSLEGFSKNISPLKARGYVTLTAYKALAFSIFLGYDRIYLIGIDNTMFKTVRVDSENRVLQSSNHISGTHSYVDLPLMDSHPKGIGDFFYDLSVLFLDLRTKFSRNNVINLDADSFVDAFPKMSKSHKYLRQNDSD